MASLVFKSRFIFKPQCYLPIVNSFRSVKRVNHKPDRQRRRMPDNPGIQNFIDANEPNHFEIEEMMQNDFDIEDVYGKYEDTVSNYDDVIKHLEEDVKFQKKIAHHKILEKMSGFKPPKETSLLTYEAKCQIKYLHSLDPQQWSPFHIASVFPISEEGAKKLIRGNWLFRNLEQVKRHNERIAHNWELLKVDSKEVSPTIRKLYQEKKWPQQLALPKEDLPQPTPLPLQKDYSKTDHTLPKNVGPFLSIVKTYLKQKQKEEQLIEGNSDPALSSSTLADDQTNKYVSAKANDGQKVLEPAQGSSDVVCSSRTKAISTQAAMKSKSPVVRPPIITKMEDIESASYIPRSALGSGINMKFSQFKEELGLPNSTTPPQLEESMDESSLEPLPKPEVLEESFAKKSQDRIRIPKQKYEKNAVYQIGTKYYDHYGNFLFKVPL